jgi:hypothetical protein
VRIRLPYAKAADRFAPTQRSSSLCLIALSTGMSQNSAIFAHVKMVRCFRVKINFRKLLQAHCGMTQDDYA